MTKSFKLWNNITGWIIFAIASVQFLLTIEPTTSLWDCGEFIACGYKLQIGHPPGAPVFMLLTRLFTMFAPNVSLVAMFANALSAIITAFTVLFLFWSITHLIRKYMVKDNDIDAIKLVVILLSGAIGALAYSFSDTNWFSAVEGEVYATSSFFTAIVFWAILKWEDEENNMLANRWLVLIAFLIGLSIGVHLLNLLVIPAMVLVYYFKNYETTRKGLFISLGIGFAILGVMQFAVIPGFVSLAAKMELIFVNGLGLPYFSGVVFYLILAYGLLAFAIYYTYIKRKEWLNIAFTMLTVILIGYSSYAIIIIRSQAEPPLDENDPENIFSLLSYLNREQYGDRPLIYGPVYNAPAIGMEDGKKQYAPRNGKYEVVNVDKKYKYDDRFMMLFPRLHSGQEEHIKAYKQWVDIKGVPIKVNGENGEEVVRKPTFGENIAFFLRYQIGHMYVRYFMWNFSGRQNDEQSFGEIFNGNWISGIPFIDNMLIGPQEHITDAAKNHKARNTYFLIPFLVGMIGMLFHLKHKVKDFSVVLALFFMTGIAIVIYLNQPPIEPRERDYTYAASFYAFAIWISFGVLAIYEFLSKKLGKWLSVGLTTTTLLIMVPGVMAQQNWDDHDRSGRYTARDLAYNYLKSCAPNAILFTNGDNDTFPLWYLQEVEGVRTDVRVINLMLLNTDWHIKQSRRKAYESERLPITIPQEKYTEGTNNIIFLTDQVKDRFVDIQDVIRFVSSEDDRTKVRSQSGELMDYIPTKNFSLKVNKEFVLANNIVDSSLSDRILPEINWSINKRYLTKSELVVMDILANNNWKRPIYFLSTGEGTLGLENYMQQEGYAYRLVPIMTQQADYFNIGRMDTDVQYNKLMNEFRYGRMNEPDVYMGHFDLRTLQVIRLRNRFTQLADFLLIEGKKDSAIAVLDRCEQLMPPSKVPYDFFVFDLISGYYKAGVQAKGKNILEVYAKQTTQELVYYKSLRKRFKESVDSEMQRSLAIMDRLAAIALQFNEKELSDQIRNDMSLHGGAFMNAPVQ